MNPVDTDGIVAEIHAERARLAELLAGLDSQRWAAASLCEGWRVREIVAHMSMPFRLSMPRLVGGLLLAGFKFNRFADRDARAATQANTDAQLLALLQDNIEHPWAPPGGGKAGALSHDVIHGLDFTVPLGLPDPPPERIAMVVDSGGPKNRAYFGVNLDNRLEATDADISIGEGDVLRLPVRDILLVVTGRRDLAETP